MQVGALLKMMHVDRNFECATSTFSMECGIPILTPLLVRTMRCSMLHMHTCLLVLLLVYSAVILHCSTIPRLIS